MPDAPEPSNADKKPTKPVGTPPDWSRVFWYLTTMFILLWIWQDVLISTTVRTIPYSEFKDYVARGEVTECTLEENVVVGEITPKESKETKAAANPAPPTIATTEKAAPETSAATSTKDAKAEASSEPSKESKPAESKEAAKPTETKKASNSADVKKEDAKKGEAKKEDAKDTKPKPFFFRTVRVDDPGLVDELQKSGAKFAGDRPSFIQTALVDWGVPIAIMVFIWFLLARRIGAAGQAMMSIGQSKARLIADRETGVTFNDVAGCDEAKVELNEVVDFLKNPARYESIGARIPKGILLVGPPGTGKTLLARAVAGEAGVPFFSLSGSDFVEMFVGVGASRVRDLFTQAVKSAPCIIFIDELDAIGRQRGVHVGAVNDEREQTLNQLLVEMDGFSANVGVIVLSATNRPDVLDRALLRPGRFDRQIVVDSPDLDGREAILRVHARSIAMESDVDLRQIARATAGFSGADLANVLNEAALLAARRQGTKVSQKDIEDAIERVLAGPERKSRRLIEDERRRVAYHEVGHALVAAYSEYADPVRKITIVPRGRAALGYTLQVPGNEQFLVTRSALFGRVRGLLGGRGAEDVVFGEVSTGAENDLDRATTIVKQMICMYGMGDAVGLMHCARQQNGYLGQSPEIGSEKLVGEQTANEIDQEVRRLLDGCYNETKELLSAHRAELERVAQELLRVETLSGDAFLGMLDHPIMKKSSEEDPALPPVPPATG